MESAQDRIRRLLSTQGASIAPDDLRFIADLTSELMNVPATNDLSNTQIAEFIESLPHLTEEDLKHLGHNEAICPVCMNTLVAIIAEEEIAIAMDSPAHPIEELGVTRLAKTCGHVFCRRDILKWVKEGHSSCPMCRRALVASSGENNSPDPEARTAHGQPIAELVELLQGMQESLAETLQRAEPNMPNMFGVQPGFFPDFSAAGREDRDDDRHEYLGMYS